MSGYKYAGTEPWSPEKPAKVLGRKRSIPDQRVWLAAMATARDHWPDRKLDDLIDRTLTDIINVTTGKRCGYGWSGGKDAQALRYLMDLAGIKESVLATTDLGFPAMARWLKMNAPDGLESINTGQNLAWLADNPECLFPSSKVAGRLMGSTNQLGQDIAYRRNGWDLLITGRRRLDGNYCGPGNAVYSNGKGITRYSPMAGWTHEAVFALLQREQIPMAPCYGWPRGFQCGSVGWSFRYGAPDRDTAWKEIWHIDSSIVRGASTVIPEAKDWMIRTGKD